ncbi:hypothetical protein HD554DRAFT_1994367, partial [Boletus coccyginus]
IKCSLEKLKKYYHKFDEKYIYVLALVLHSYYKLTYTKMAWGDLRKPRAEIKVKNLNTRDWCDNTLKVIEKMIKKYW